MCHQLHRLSPTSYSHPPPAGQCRLLSECRCRAGYLPTNCDVDRARGSGGLRTDCSRWSIQPPLPSATVSETRSVGLLSSRSVQFRRSRDDAVLPSSSEDSARLHTAFSTGRATCPLQSSTGCVAAGGRSEADPLATGGGRRDIYRTESTAGCRTHGGGGDETSHGCRQEADADSSSGTAGKFSGESRWIAVSVLLMTRDYLPPPAGTSPWPRGKVHCRVFSAHGV